MNMIIHNLKVAVRNLMKYKLQVIISVLSIAVGIVTLALVHAYVSYYKFPGICSQPYYERTYSISIEPTEAEKKEAESGGWYSPPSFTPDMIRALKRDGGLNTAERMAVPNNSIWGDRVEYQLCDSTKRQFYMNFTAIDPEYLTFIGLRSAITGQPVKKLRPGEAIISKVKATFLFGNASPVGGVCYNLNNRYPMPHTIVDVFEDVSLMERCMDNFRVYFSLGEIEDVCEHYLYAPLSVNIVLRQGCTESQLLAEVNERLKPFDRTIKMEKESDSIESGTIINIQFFAHLAGSLILLAAIIGFLRMQMQLFWMRRREVSLRMVNGAKRGQLFRLLFTEVFLVVVLAVAVAMMMGVWTEDFIYSRFADIVREARFNIKGFALYGLYIGGGLLLVCALVIWLTLMRICNAGQGLAAHMRRSRTHLFRNVMLGMQISICFVFVCASLVIIDWGNKMMDRYHLPNDLTPYKESILLYLNDASEYKEPLKREIAQLPSLKEMTTGQGDWVEIFDIKENEEAMAAFNNIMHKTFFPVKDTSLIAFLQCKINWFDKPVNAGEYLILDEDLYKKLRKLNLAGNDMLTVGCYGRHTLPIAGTVQGVPYEMEPTSFMVHPGVADNYDRFVLIPKEGKYKSLVKEVDAAIQRVEPSIVEQMAQNFHESHTEVMMVNTTRTVGWILAAVSLLICAMSIYSTIALDTRSRKKEVAIRKINGAKSGDIYRLFGRLYLVLVAIGLVVALPVVLKFREMFYDGFSHEEVVGTPLAALFAAGSLIVIVLIAAIVTWNIRSIMRTNPSEIIAKE